MHRSHYVTLWQFIQDVFWLVFADFDLFSQGDLQSFFFMEMLLFFPLDVYVEKFVLQEIRVNIKLGAHCFWK